MDSTGYSLIVSTLLHDQFAELLAELPDEFYYLEDPEKTNAWRAIYAAALHGERDIAKLATCYRIKTANQLTI